MVKLAEADIQTREVLTWKGVHLFHHPISSCSQKTRIFLALKNVAWESHVVDLAGNENISPWFLGINPRGLVPVLVHDGEVHIESNDILVHLEKAFPAPCLIPAAFASQMGELLRHEDDLHLDLRALSFRFVFNPPSTPKTTDVLERYARTGSGTVHGAADTGKAEQIAFWQRYAAEDITDATVRTAVARFRRAFDDMEGRLTESRYLLGDDLTVLDIAWFIYVFRLALAGYPIARLHPRVAAWFEGLQNRPELAAEVALPPPFRAFIDATHRQHAAEGRTLADIAGV